MYIKLRKVFVHTSLNHPVIKVYKSKFFLRNLTFYSAIACLCQRISCNSLFFKKKSDALGILKSLISKAGIKKQK